jgi:hypothetical protein
LKIDKSMIKWFPIPLDPNLNVSIGKQNRL